MPPRSQDFEDPYNQPAPQPQTQPQPTQTGALTDAQKKQLYEQGSGTMGGVDWRNDPTLKANVDYAMKNIDSSAGSGRWEGGGATPEQAQEQWARYYASGAYDPNCPPDKPFRSEAGGGACREKPVDVAEGESPVGGGGPGGGGGGGGMGGYGGGGGDLAMYMLKQQYADALNDPTGQAAWNLFAGQGGAQNAQASIDAERQAIAGMPAGPARQAAEQRLREQETNMRIQMPQQARASAMAGLSGIMQPELGYVGSERDRQLQRMLGLGNLSLGQGQLALSGELGRGQLGLQTGAQNWQQNTYFPWQQQEANTQREWQAEQNRLEQEAQKRAQGGGWKSALGGILGSAAGSFLGPIGTAAGASLGKKISDIRMKEDIAPGRRGLTDLRKLKQYSYKYLGAPERQQGVMAQDLEKVAPELVHELDSGIKYVDSYGLLSMTMNAVKELDRKLHKRA